MNRIYFFLKISIFLLLIFGFSKCSNDENSPNTKTNIWTKLSGTSNIEAANSIAIAQSGNIYITGYTNGDLDDQSNQGTSDIFIMKYDKDGNKLWTKLLGTIETDIGRDIAIDSSENIYITGYTNGNLDKKNNAGLADAFVAKYDKDGNKLWVKLSGTSEEDEAYGITVDKSGNAFITGYTNGNLDQQTNNGKYDIFVTKFDSDGNKLWTQLSGTSMTDKGFDIIVDSNGNFYVTGQSSGYGTLDGEVKFGNSDIFVIKYGSDSQKLWTRVLGTANIEEGQAIDVDTNGNIYVTGKTDGKLDKQEKTGGLYCYNTFIAKYDKDGNKQWTKLTGNYTTNNSQPSAYSNDIVCDANGNIFITGYTEGSLDSQSNAGKDDIFIMKYDKDGNKLWTKQSGTSSFDKCYAIDKDTDGFIYIAGETGDKLDEQSHKGESDIFIQRWKSDGTR